MSSSSSALAPMPQTPSQAITMTQARQVSIGLGPQNLEQAWALADALAKSDLVPEAYQGRPANVIAMISMANDLGIGITQAMREIYPMGKGRVGTSAALCVSLVRQSGLCELWETVETTKERATVRTKRKGSKEQSYTYTLEEAKEAGLYPGKEDSAWRKHPKLMLRHRAEKFLADMEYQDVVRGLKTTDEVGEVVDAGEVRVVTLPGGTTAINVTPQPTSAAPQQPTEAKPSATATEEVPPHDPVTGKVKEPAQTSGAASADPVDALIAKLQAAKTTPELETVRGEVDGIVPKGHGRRSEVGRIINARRAELNGAGR